jgi:hypothetical protein
VFLFKIFVPLVREVKSTLAYFSDLPYRYWAGTSSRSSWEKIARIDSPLVCDLPWSIRFSRSVGKNLFCRGQVLMQALSRLCECNDRWVMLYGQRRRSGMHVAKVGCLSEAS